MTKHASRQTTHAATCNWQSKENRILLESRRSSVSLEIPSVSGSHKSKPGHEPGTRVKEGIKAGVAKLTEAEGERKKRDERREEEEEEEEEKRREKIIQRTRQQEDKRAGEQRARVSSVGPFGIAQPFLVGMLVTRN
ncbi:hypothetical protein K0M31_015927 [Melipona bicolor]|uniref:Uncharacterized protein n=1 Tax=Melipona bicolor TaxID=60889 RepID=A0AA40G5Z7_9HYME|nr:hypothetical protein K0M31_015927 [Melipona bicolor]